MIFGQDVLLATLPPTRNERRLAAAVALTCLLVFLVAAPVAATPLPQVPAFISVYQSLLVLSDLVTAVLLMGQFTKLRSPALLVLSCGYLFAALMAAVHMLTFPGLFSATGLLGAGGQTTAWLYMFWHGGFALAVSAYALLRRAGDRQRIAARRRRLGILCGVGGVLALVGLLTMLATNGTALLPPIMQGNAYTSSMIFVILSIWALCLVSLVVLWWQKPHAVLDLWLMVVMCAWLSDIALSAVLNAGRFDLGFYVGRINGLFASSFVLVMLLVETLRIHGRLVASNEFLSDLANRDGLTGIHNWRALDARLRAELSRAQRIRQPVSFLMIDVDNFKKFNDTYGHLDGDTCLREIAVAISRVAKRPGDMAARFGGEEFAVVLAGIEGAGATQMAELARRAVIDAAIPHAASAIGVVTVSIGITTVWPDMMSTIDEIVAAADRALYEAKAGGRNQVATARELPPMPARDTDAPLQQMIDQLGRGDRRETE